jgi:hypothetical protein
VLYLNPPFPMIRGVALFPDHLDPLQWYFMPAAPKLSLIADPVAGHPKPALQLIKFRGDAGTGGFLNFDVNIGIEEEVLDDIKDELRSPQFKLPPGPIKLSPVPLTGGTVRLLLLGQESPAPTPAPGPGTGTPATPAPGDAPPLKFVTKISHEAHPSLYGDNQAAFSVALDQYGVTVLEQSLAGNMSPIAVVYALEYLGLRPAYSVHLNIDWDRVQKHMDEHFGADTLFTSVSVDNAVDELIEKKIIVLEADTFVPEGEDTQSIISNRDRALNEVRDMITDAFFTSSIDPVKPRSDDWDKATRTAARVGAIIATGGWGGIATLSYNKQNYTRIDKKVLDVNIRERTTVKRNIYPQGHLVGLFQVLRDQHLNMSDFVVEANLNDPWFQRRVVEVTSIADFDTDSIASLNVHLTYGSEPKNLLIEKATPKQEVKWLSHLTNGSMDLPVTVQYEVNFRGVDPTTRPLQVKSAPEVITVEKLPIQPRALYSIVPIPVAVPNPATFPWARYPQVEVRLEYQDAANGIHLQDVLFLDATGTNASKTWNLFARQTDVTFRYRLIYRAANNKDVDTDWRTSDAREVMVRDPFPAKRSVLMVPPPNWTSLDQLFVDCFYEDAKNKFRQEDSFNFSESDMANKAFTVDLRDPTQRRVGFAVTFIDKNGGVFQIPRSYTLDNRIILRSDMMGHRVVTVRPTKIDFDARKLRDLSVELRYADADAGLRYASQLAFKSTADQGAFEFDYVDQTKSRYEYRLSASFRNGMTQDFDWKATDVDDLILEF